MKAICLIRLVRAVHPTVTELGHGDTASSLTLKGQGVSRFCFFKSFIYTGEDIQVGKEPVFIVDQCKSYFNLHNIVKLLTRSYNI